MSGREPVGCSKNRVVSTNFNENMTTTKHFTPSFLGFDLDSSSLTSPNMGEIRMLTFEMIMAL
jgi:hypothetical protein